MENEIGNFEKMFKAGGMKTAPPGLDELIMRKINALERRNSIRRLAWLLVVKIFAICTILFFFVSAIWKTIPELYEESGLNQIPGIWSQALHWIEIHLTFIVPVLVVLILTRLLLPKLEN